jgi:ribosomal protein L22
MNFSDEAVESAAAAIHSRTSSAQPWREVRQDVRGEYISDAIAALAAAAPQLIAEAWERGREDCYHHRPNPYKETGE